MMMEGHDARLTLPSLLRTPVVDYNDDSVFFFSCVGIVVWLWHVIHPIDYNQVQLQQPGQ